MNPSAPKSNQPGKLWKNIGGATLLYTLLTLLLTDPVFRHLNRAVAGFDGRDPFQHVWYQWWLKETLLELGVWPDWVSHLYYPLGAAHPVLALHPYVPLASLPFTLLFGPLISYNIAFLLTFILSGLAGYLLCRYISNHTGAALIGGLIFAFYPNRFGHAAAGHLLLNSTYFLPLYALSLLILLRRPTLKIAIWHGVVAALLALTQPTHIGYGMIPITLVLVAAHLLGRHMPLRNLVWLGAAYLVALLLFLPFAWPLLRQAQSELAYLTPDNLTKHSTDLLAFIMPSPYNPLLLKMGLVPAFSATLVDGLRDLEEQLAYPGLVAMGLLLLALWKQWRTARIWLALTLLCGLLSLGPLLKVGGEVKDFPLPYTWLTYMPFFAWSRTPGRLNETMMLGVAVLAAIGAAWLLGRWRQSSQRRTLLAVGLGALILAEYLVIFPFPTEHHPVSNYYRQLADESPNGGVLEVPVAGSRRASNYAMYHQTIHEHPLAGGYIERDPTGTVELKEFLNQLISPLPDQTIFANPDETQRRAILTDMNITQLIAQPTLMTDRAARARQDYLPLLLGPPSFEDETIRVYDIQPEAVNNLPVQQLLPDQDNWEVLQEGATLRLKKEGYLFIYAAEAGQATLNFQVDGPPKPTRLTLRFNEAELDPYLLETATAQNTGPLTLRQGLNYIYLSTEPSRDITFFEISIQADSNQTID